jgi:hypothetical protein
MTQPQKTAYRFFQKTIILLILYGIAALLSAVKFLSPSDALLTALPYYQTGALTNILLNLAALTGLVGGGIYIAAQYRVRGGNLLRLMGQTWSILLILAVLAGLFGLSEGRNLLELPAMLDIAFLVALLVIVTIVASGARSASIIQVWSVGMLVSAACMALGLLVTGDYVQDRLLRAMVIGLNHNVGYLLAAVALGLWLMHRFSNLTLGWINQDVYIVGGLVMLAGVFITLPTLPAAPEWVGGLGNLATFLAPILYLIFAGHAYRALTDRNQTYTLAAHWFAFSLLLLLLGPGLMGGLLAAPGIRQWTVGTRLSDLQTTFTLFVSVTMALGVINQSAAELRGQNWRVTGLMPYWLVTFGMLGGGLALAAGGVVQVFMERMSSIGYLDVQNLVTPLYAGWVFGLILLTLGILVYALGFRARRVL